jgi:hypothetical protein
VDPSASGAVIPKDSSSDPVDGRASPFGLVFVVFGFEVVRRQAGVGPVIPGLCVLPGKPGENPLPVELGTLAPKDPGASPRGPD